MKMQSSHVFCDLKWCYNEKMLFSFSVNSDFIFWQKCTMPIIVAQFQNLITINYDFSFKLSALPDSVPVELR